MPQYSGIWTEQAVMQAVGAGNWPGNPGAPTIGTATAGDASASVTFTAPTDNGGSAITGYTVTSSPGGLTGTGASSPITVSGLTNGTAYTFTVTATNATGTGPASAASNSVTPAEPVYIENVYSTYLYTGNDSTQTITNGIDLATKGGLVWIKVRDYADSHRLFDTSRGVGKYLVTNGTFAETTNAASVTAFNSNGFGLGDFAGTNGTAFGSQYASWTFRKQPKFFDVVTYTGTGSAQNIAHNLGSVPGCIIIKNVTSGVFNWQVYHRGLTSAEYCIQLNTTEAESSGPSFFNSTDPTSSVFSVGTANGTNASGNNFVAYLFAHNAGGFGLSGTDNVISCGSWSGSTAVNLGYEPQWILFRNSGAADNWTIVDNMRGWPEGAFSQQAQLYANSSGAESGGSGVFPTATGFSATNLGAGNFIYIAIRRGPMKVPTSGTSVFDATANAGTGSTKFITTNFPVDLTIQSNRNDVISHFTDRLRGGGANASPRIYSQFTDAETNASAGRGINFDSNTGVTNLLTYNNGVGDNFIYYAIRRAPSFFDEVCYTGTGTTTARSHNLGVAPELVIVKVRSSSGDNWFVLNTSGTARLLRLNSSAEDSGGVETVFGNGSVYIAPTSTNFTVGGFGAVNQSGSTFVAYLFATCAGVSKVGSYTGTGALQTINCGFAAGARFVLIKRTDSTGDWYTYDSARGITSSNDPYLLLNSTAAEVTGTNYVDTTSVGFQVTAAAPAGLNASGGTYIFLAIA